MALPLQNPVRREVETVAAPTPPTRLGIAEALRQCFEIVCLPDDIKRALYRIR